MPELFPVTPFESRVRTAMDRIRTLYLADMIPWVVGYSGGKDSTTTLQLVWYTLRELDPADRQRKPVHVISTDTLVEQPIVAAWVNESLKRMAQAARAEGLPIVPHRLTPEIKDSYWVNLIGRGYPAPRQGFRWCTSRLKIAPSNRFILDMVRRDGETILLLGTRRAESASRARIMDRYASRRVRDWLSPNGNLPNSWVFTPIEDWTNDDVWEYLITVENPWGRSNQDLLDMYRGANPDNECPLVIDTSTPSCGGSRFGCWVCTVVAADRSMEAMVHNDAEKAWMMPLLAFRNEIGALGEDGRINDRARRDFRRLDGTIKVNPRNGRAIPGPYTKAAREHLLRRLLAVQQEIQTLGPKNVADLTLISDEELREIRRIWVEEKHEFDDAVPRIYEEMTGRPWPYSEDLPRRVFDAEAWRLLQDLCGDDFVHLELVSSILDLEQQATGTIRGRARLDDALLQQIRRCYYRDEEDALLFAQAMRPGPDLSASAPVVPTPAQLRLDDYDAVPDWGS